MTDSITTELAHRMREAMTRKVRNWGVAVMRTCDFCAHHKMTVIEEGATICASCCDAEYAGAMRIALEEATDALAAKDKQVGELTEWVNQAEARNNVKCAEMCNQDEVIADLRDRLSELGMEQQEFAEALGCPGDNESILEAIDGLKDQVRTIDMSNSVLQAQLEARPEQQPMFYMEAKAAERLIRGHTRFATVTEKPKPGKTLPLYTSPPAAQPVTVKLPLPIGFSLGNKEPHLLEQSEVIAALTAAGITIAEGE